MPLVTKCKVTKKKWIRIFFVFLHFLFKPYDNKLG